MRLNMNNAENNYKAKGSAVSRFFKIPFLYLAWFSPHKSMRVFFHKLRGVDIGKNVEIGYFCIIGNVHPNRIRICDEAVITARTTILEHDNSFFYTRGGNVSYGNVVVGEKAFIGIGSVIMPNVVIGKRVIVGALSFVNKSIPDYSVVAGCPAKSIGGGKILYSPKE